MCEFQSAYELSSIERAMTPPSPEKVAEAAKVAALLAAGRFVVMAEVLAHCRFTDAVLGCDYYYATDCASYDEATAWIEEHYLYAEGFSVRCPEGFVVPRFVYVDDDAF
jgi:hypothetical protein